MDFRTPVAFIERYDKFIITTHETPDGDALGAEYAMSLALRRLGKTADILNADPAPEKYQFLDPRGEFRVIGNEADLPPDLDERALLLLDVSDFNNIGQVRDLVLPRVKDLLIVDHHTGSDEGAREKMIAVDASSTCEILYFLFQRLSLVPDPEMALALYTGLVYDTGSFIYPKTTARTFEIARHLVELGVSPNHVYTQIYENNSISSLVLTAKVVATLELHVGERVAVQHMSRLMILEAKSSYEEADQLINIPLRSKNIVVSIFFKENLQGLTRCSMRSKGDIDVSEIAGRFGGGGHKNAAGFKCRAAPALIKAELLELFRRMLAAGG